MADGDFHQLDRREIADRRRGQRRYERDSADPTKLYARTLGGARIHRRDCRIITEAAAMAEEVRDAGYRTDGPHGEWPTLLTQAEALALPTPYMNAMKPPCRLCAPDGVEPLRPASRPKYRGSGLGWPLPDGSCAYTPAPREWSTVGR